jgi:lipoprotein-releasing system ATP-binding protein
MAEFVLQAAGLSKRYRSGDREIAVLQGADVAVHAGESVSIRGESGSGKTTLLNLLAGLDASEGGEIRWAGTGVMGLGNNALAGLRARFLGMVFQAYYLIPEIDALANVLLARRMLGRVGAAERTRARALLARVGLAERGHHLPAQLSGGERQRVAIARALVNRPAVIMGDEPTGNLDSTSSAEVIDMMREINLLTGTTFILVTHDPDVAEACDRVIHMRDGVVTDDTARLGLFAPAEDASRELAQVA